MEGRQSHDKRAGRRLPRINLLAGFTLIGAGLLLLAVVATYYGYGVYARSRLDRLNVSVADARAIRADSVAYDVASASHADSDGQPQNGRSARPSGVAPIEPAEPAAEGVDLLLLRYGGLYPGLQIHPKYWHEPMWAGSDTRQAQGLPEGYSPASASSEWNGARGQRPAARILIPTIGVDSGVSDLAILDLGDSRAYETPNNTVGHIPGTSDPGGVDNGWFFGHLESPIRGEGNVFRRLPEIPERLRNYIETGEDPVYVSLVTDDGEYLYQVSATQVVPQDDLHLYGSEDSTITLVACVPRLVYDHRLLVTAKLVGYKG